MRCSFLAILSAAVVLVVTGVTAPSMAVLGVGLAGLGMIYRRKAV